MAKYLLKRVLQAIGVVFCISLITFFVLNIVPGNPVEIMLGEFADQATIARVTHEMGLATNLYSIFQLVRKYASRELWNIIFPK